MNPAEGKPSWAKRCTCRLEYKSLGRLDKVSMGKGWVRMNTTPGCPEHNTCRGYTVAVRKASERGYWLQCPIHGGRNCPDNGGHR